MPYIDTLILNPLNAEINLICHLMALLGAHHILHIGRIRVKCDYAVTQVQSSFFAMEIVVLPAMQDYCVT